MVSNAINGNTDLPKPHAIGLGRAICSDLTQSTQREWLITNGTGSYGCGTLSGILTRCYHGLLIAALKPPLGRTLLLTKLDETAQYQGTHYPLSCDRWSGGTTTGHGYRNLESFHLEGAIPTWRYACADALLEKRIWMQPGENTTYIRYTLCRASGPLSLSIKAIVNYRDHHSTTQIANEGKTGQFQTQSHPRGLKVQAVDQATPVYLLTSRGQLMPVNKWYQHYFLTTEKYRGLSHLDDNCHVATLRTTLSAGESVTVVASTQPTPNLDGENALSIRQQYENSLLQVFSSSLQNVPPDGGQVKGEAGPEVSVLARPTSPWIEQLVLAADQFVVDRTAAETPNGKTIIAGYPWFGDWGRDTMIALPGLTLATGRPEIARPILRTFARYLNQGMLPNAFPEANDTPGYNTVDAILWYFEAIRLYVEVTQDFELLEELFPALKEAVDWHVRGTRYNIRVDPSDGLLYAGELGAQLTWMDAKVDAWVVTPRIGKPVEINALWLNALFCMASFAEQLNEPKNDYTRLSAAASDGFKRFWNSGRSYCYDLLDGPDGPDASLRPNQIFAVSLEHGPMLTSVQNKAVVDACAQQLLTSHGLRSLSPSHPDYIGVYGGDRYKRDGAYHQGTVWAWLIGPFVQAHLKVYKNPELARTFLSPFAHSLSAGCLGTLSEIFDGDAPFTPRGAYAQAWSVAEVLRVWRLM